MTEAKPPTVVELVWEHDLVLGGRTGDHTITLDSASAEGPSPMQALALGLAGCMAMDVIHVIRKGRHDLKGLRADLVGDRAPEDPRRFVSIKLHYAVIGAVPDAVVARAIQLSRDKYCSVWHSMRQDIAFDVTYAISQPA